jgi:hypothetical protein
MCRNTAVISYTMSECAVCRMVFKHSQSYVTNRAMIAQSIVWFGYVLLDRKSSFNSCRSKNVLSPTTSNSALYPPRPLFSGYRVFFSLGVNWSWLEAGQSRLTSAKVRKQWSYTSIPPHDFTMRSGTIVNVQYLLSHSTKCLDDDKR